MILTLAWNNFFLNANNPFSGREENLTQALIHMAIEIGIFVLVILLLNRLKSEKLHKGITITLTVVTVLLTATMFFVIPEGYRNLVAWAFSLSMPLFLASLISLYHKYADSIPILQKLSRIYGKI